MYIDKLIEQLLVKRSKGEVIKDVDWPEELILASDKFDKHLRTLQKYTSSEGPRLFLRKQGSFGWEYAISVIWLLGELYITKPVHGDTRSVIPIQSFSLKPKEINQSKGTATFTLTVGSESIITKPFDIKTFNEKAKLNQAVGLAMIVHTHPKYHHDESVYQYSFFSPADITALISSSTSIIGLITENTLWLACKTANLRTVPTQDLYQITQLELQGGEDQMKNYISQNMRGSGLVFYFGKFGSILRRVN